MTNLLIILGFFLVGINALPTPTGNLEARSDIFAQPPVLWDGTGEIRQMPIDSLTGGWMEQCFLAEGQECESGRGKDFHEYCTCGDGLTCDNHVCTADFSPFSEPIEPADDDYVVMQRPLGGPIGSGAVVMACSLPLNHECEAPRKSIAGYCQCGEGMECVSHTCVVLPGFTEADVLTGDGWVADDIRIPPLIETGDDGVYGPVVQSLSPPADVQIPVKITTITDVDFNEDVKVVEDPSVHQLFDGFVI